MHEKKILCTGSIITWTDYYMSYINQEMLMCDNKEKSYFPLFEDHYSDKDKVWPSYSSSFSGGGSLLNI